MALKLFKLIFLLFIIFGAYANIQRRYRGTIVDFKVIGDKNSYLIVWLKTTQREYQIKYDRPSNMGLRDSLFEYWIDYRCNHVGSNKDPHYYEIIK